MRSQQKPWAKFVCTHEGYAQAEFMWRQAFVIKLALMLSLGLWTASSLNTIVVIILISPCATSLKIAHTPCGRSMSSHVAKWQKDTLHALSFRRLGIFLWRPRFYFDINCHNAANLLWDFMSYLHLIAAAQFSELLHACQRAINKRLLQQRQQK